MMKHVAFVLLSLISIFANGQDQSEIDYYKASCDSFPFSNYKVVNPTNFRVAKLDSLTLKGFPSDIISNISEKYHKIKSPNFSGYYIIISWGCGSPCQMNAIIDSRTGKVEKTFSTSNGLNFKNNSNLLILDPPDKSKFDKNYRDMIGAPKFYIWRDHKLEKLKK